MGNRGKAGSSVSEHTRSWEPLSAENELPVTLKREREQTLAILTPLVTLMGKVVGPNTEVVLHDLAIPSRSVVAIANGHVSGREKGASILDGPSNDKGFHEAQKLSKGKGMPGTAVIENYTTLSSIGTELISSTLLLRDTQGLPYAAFCINTDQAFYKQAQQWFDHVLSSMKPNVSKITKMDNESRDMESLMKNIISEAVAQFGKPVVYLSREEKLHAVKVMLERGLFMMKGSVTNAAKILNVSRYTIYNYLDEIKDNN
ncbi:TPA: PAS domain-containing protein [Klebsiella pneumoniae]|nr:PAS domain-containing protein [Klebsiella pneumoniae]HBR1478483.1 PAS domain-containing protein [Klebsiella pneumoniae]